MNHPSRSYIILDPTQEIRLRDDVDNLTLSRLFGKNSIGIDQVRELKEWAALKPFSRKIKVVAVLEAQKLTTEAQNSLLKILEEPPSQTLILLFCRNYRDLLPTIRSRCVLIRNQKELEDLKEINELLARVDGEDLVRISYDELQKMTIPELFIWAEKLSKDERGAVSHLLLNWVKEEHEKIMKGQVKNAQALKNLYRSKIDVEKGISLRLLLEVLFLEIYQQNHPDWAE